MGCISENAALKTDHIHILFLLYTYELPNYLTNQGLMCKMYADDVKVYKKKKLDASDEVSFQSAINYTSSWADKLGVPLAHEKNGFLTIGFKKQSQFPTYNISGQV